MLSDKNEAMREGWETEKHPHESQEEPTDHPSYQQSWQHNTYMKETTDDASEDLREKESWAIFIAILVIFLKGRKKHSKIIKTKN